MTTTDYTTDIFIEREWDNEPTIEWDVVPHFATTEEPPMLTAVSQMSALTGQLMTEVNDVYDKHVLSQRDQDSLLRSLNDVIFGLEIIRNLVREVG